MSRINTTTLPTAHPMEVLSQNLEGTNISVSTSTFDISFNIYVGQEEYYSGLVLTDLSKSSQPRDISMTSTHSLPSKSLSYNLDSSLEYAHKYRLQVDPGRWITRYDFTQSPAFEWVFITEVGTHTVEAPSLNPAHNSIVVRGSFSVIRLQFNEILAVKTGFVILSRVSDGNIMQTWTEANLSEGSTMQLLVSTSLDDNVQYELTVSDTLFESLAGLPFVGIAAGEWRFRTKGLLSVTPTLSVFSLSLYLSIYLSLPLSLYLSIYIYLSLSLSLSIYLSF